MIRPDKLRLEPAGPSQENRLPGTIRQRLFLGGHFEYLVEVGADTVRVISVVLMQEGAPVLVAFDAVDCVALAGAGAAVS